MMVLFRSADGQCWLLLPEDPGSNLSGLQYFFIYLFFLSIRRLPVHVPPSVPTSHPAGVQVCVTWPRGRGGGAVWGDHSGVPVHPRHRAQYVRTSLGEYWWTDLRDLFAQNYRLFPNGTIVTSFPKNLTKISQKWCQTFPIKHNNWFIEFIIQRYNSVELYNINFKMQLNMHI